MDILVVWDKLVEIIEFSLQRSDTGKNGVVGRSGDYLTDEFQPKATIRACDEVGFARHGCDQAWGVTTVRCYGWIEDVALAILEEVCLWIQKFVFCKIEYLTHSNVDNAVKIWARSTSCKQPNWSCSWRNWNNARLLQDRQQKDMELEQTKSLRFSNFIWIIEIPLETYSWLVKQGRRDLSAYLLCCIGPIDTCLKAEHAE